MQKYFGICARFDTQPHNDIPLVIDNKVLPLFTSKDKAGEFLAFTKDQMREISKANGSFNVFYVKITLLSAKEYLSKRKSPVQLYFIDPSPAENKEEIMRNAIPF